MNNGICKFAFIRVKQTDHRVDVSCLVNDDIDCVCLSCVGQHFEDKYRNCITLKGLIFK